MELWLMWSWYFKFSNFDQGIWAVYVNCFDSIYISHDLTYNDIIDIDWCIWNMHPISGTRGNSKGNSIMAFDTGKWKKFQFPR